MREAREEIAARTAACRNCARSRPSVLLLYALFAILYHFSDLQTMKITPFGTFSQLFLKHLFNESGASANESMITRRNVNEVWKGGRSFLCCRGYLLSFIVSGRCMTDSQRYLIH